jgi:putative transposase
MPNSFIVMDSIKRIRTDPAIVAYGLYLYFNSRSYRFACKSLEAVTKRTHVAIWKWVQKYSLLAADRFVIGKRRVKEIFVDETLVRINGQNYWLWLAYEPTLHVCLLFHLSRERTIFVCYQFFKEIRSKFGRNKPIYTDGAYWYNDACKWLRLKHIIYGVELKNIMERFIQHIKDRTECFDDNFPCKIRNCSRQHVNNWIRMYLLYLHMKTDRVRFISFITRNTLS